MHDNAPTDALAASDRLLTAVRLADLACQGAKETLLRDLDLSPALYGAMLMLSEEPDLTAAEIARRCGVTPQTMSSLLQRLIGKDWVEREAHPQYRHVTTCRLTAPGQEVFGQADERIRRLEARLRSTVSPAELRALKDVLQRVGAAAGQLVDETASAPAD